MNFNNGFPVNYQPAQIYPSIQAPVNSSISQPVQQAQPGGGIVWVQGEAGAKAYPVASGMSQLLMDSENRQFYIKSTDMSGMPLPLRIFTYEEIKEVPQTSQSVSNAEYITREEFEKRLSELKPSRQYAKKEEKKDGE